MAVKFQDYYQTLGVSRGATPAEIQRAYRKLARQYHPDLNKAKDAEARFKQINEAYEVLKDPEKRSRYDRLGANWKEGQGFTPPPDWDAAQGPGNHGGGFHFRTSGEPGDFSDFFEMFFGRGAAGGRGNMEDMLRQAAAGRGGSGGGGFGPSGDFAGSEAPAAGGGDIESEITISLADACFGATRQVRLQSDGGGPAAQRTLEIKVPKGVTDGSTIRLKGQGIPSRDGGPAGDLLLHLHVAPDPRFELDGRNLICRLPVSPWEAALGAKVPVATLDGQVTVTIPPGARSGRKLRLRGKGLPGRGGQSAGDLLIQLEVVVPPTLTDRERELFEQLKQESKFDPRTGA
jgi:curved DNA-binding protein